MFDVDSMIEQLKSAAQSFNAVEDVHKVLMTFFVGPEEMVKGKPDYAGIGVILFEDETGSTWHSRFLPGISVPPHDHKMGARIGVHRGRERMGDSRSSYPLRHLCKSRTLLRDTRLPWKPDRCGSVAVQPPDARKARFYHGGF